MNLLKNTIIIFFLALAFLSNPIAKTIDYPYLEEVEIPNIQAKNILLFNLNDNKILYEKQAQEKIAIASLTKIMTTIVAIENIKNLEEIVKVPKEAFYNISGYAIAGFKTNDEVTYKDLLYGTLLPSGIDAAQSLAILTCGSIENFVEKMNEMATKLEMNNTHYNNPVGKDHEENYSSLSDIAKLLFYALKNETFYEIYTSRNYLTLNNLELNSTLVMPSLKYNLNIDNIIGSKSGFTKEAGLCLSSLAEFNGVKYLLITAGSLYENGFPNHIVDSLNIYNYFWNNYSYQMILKKDDFIHSIKVLDSEKEYYDIKNKENIEFYLKNGMVEELSYVYNGIDYIDRKIKMNDKLGTIDVYYKDFLLYSYEVYLEENIVYKNYYLVYVIILLVIISLFLIVIKIYNNLFKKYKNI